MMINKIPDFSFYPCKLVTDLKISSKILIIYFLFSTLLKYFLMDLMAKLQRTLPKTGLILDGEVTHLDNTEISLLNFIK